MENKRVSKIIAAADDMSGGQSPFLGFFEDFEATWCDHPAFSPVQKSGVVTPRGLKILKKP